MIVEVLELSMRNFLSYGNNTTVINFNRGGKTTMIVGENLDDAADGSAANGAGKSAIINAIAYALYDKPISDISKDKLINNINRKNMEVGIVYRIGSDVYQIRRTRGAKVGAAGNYVHYWKNGTDITPDSVDNTNALIEADLGVPYEIFVRVVVFTANHRPFLELPAKSTTGPNQTAILEELFGLSSVSAKAKLLSSQASECEKRLEFAKRQVEIQEQEIARREALIASARNRMEQWESTHEQQIKQTAKQIAAAKHIDFETEHRKLQELEALRAELTNVQSAARKHKRDVQTCTAAIEKAQAEQQHLENATCPYCSQHYAEAKLKLVDVVHDLDEHEKRLTLFTESLNQANEHVSQLSSKIDELENDISYPSIAALVAAQNGISVLESKLEDLLDASNPHVETLSDLENAELPVVDYAEINELSDTHKHMKFLQKLLTRKDSFVRKKLLDTYLPFLNGRLEHYLRELGLSHQVEFTHEMVASISKFGRELDFGNLSNGQKARVNLALAFAFRDYIEKTNVRFNMCILDEVLDSGLDSSGVQAAIRMLKHKARDTNTSLFVITHRSDVESAFDYDLRVRLQDGFSNIVDSYDPLQT